jgi:tRNA(Ile)-lysidine synthase
MLNPELQSAIDSVPAGPWAVGVSGGADSVALLSLLRTRGDLSLVVAHLDHETRAGGSAADAAFVRELCATWHIPFIASTFSAIEPQLHLQEANRSARWRDARRLLYHEVVNERSLRGVILAHHADDQAETVFHRLLRGSPVEGLGGMSREKHFDGLLILRPLLEVRRAVLRDYLRSTAQAWREDESNASPDYARNRIRRLLMARPQLVEPLLDLGACCREVKSWLDMQAPVLGAQFRVSEVRALPAPVARRALLRWLREHSDGSTEPDAAARLWEMANDAASPPRQHFPGGVLVRRRGGVIFVDRGH